MGDKKAVELVRTTIKKIKLTRQEIRVGMPVLRALGWIVEDFDETSVIGVCERCDGIILFGEPRHNGGECDICDPCSKEMEAIADGS